MLCHDPSTAEDFDLSYGKGSAEYVLKNQHLVNPQPPKAETLELLKVHKAHLKPYILQKQQELKQKQQQDARKEANKDTGEVQVSETVKGGKIYLRGKEVSTNIGDYVKGSASSVQKTMDNMVSTLYKNVGFYALQEPVNIQASVAKMVKCHMKDISPQCHVASRKMYDGVGCPSNWGTVMEDMVDFVNKGVKAATVALEAAKARVQVALSQSLEAAGRWVKNVARAVGLTHFFILKQCIHCQTRNEISMLPLTMRPSVSSIMQTTAPA